MNSRYKIGLANTRSGNPVILKIDNTFLAKSTLNKKRFFIYNKNVFFTKFQNNFFGNQYLRSSRTKLTTIALWNFWKKDCSLTGFIFNANRCRIDESMGGKNRWKDEFVFNFQRAPYRDGARGSVCPCNSHRYRVGWSMCFDCWPSNRNTGRLRADKWAAGSAARAPGGADAQSGRHMAP